MRTPTSRSVAMIVVRSVSTSIFTFSRIGFGLRVGATLAAIWKADSNFSRSQVSFIARVQFLSYS